MAESSTAAVQRDSYRRHFLLLSSRLTKTDNAQSLFWPILLSRLALSEIHFFRGLAAVRAQAQSSSSSHGLHVIEVEKMEMMTMMMGLSGTNCTELKGLLRTNNSILLF